MKKILKIVMLLMLLLGAGAAIAAPNMASPNSVTSGFDSFISGVNTKVANVLTSPIVMQDVMLLFNFFAVLLVIWTMYLYAFGKGTIVDLLSTAILIMMVKVLMGQFSVLTTAIWSAGNGYVSSVQTALLGNGDLFFAPTFIANLINSLDFSASPVVNFVNGFIAGIYIAIITVITFLLSALAYFATIWAFWGYTIAKLIGLLFVPFLLYERLSWLFDGWLRFFFGFIVYAIVARLNIALVALAIAAYFGVTPALGVMTPITVAPISSITQVFGLFVFCMVGLLAIVSTGSFVSTIVGGSASSTGIGSMLSRGAGKLAGKALGG